LVIFLKNPKVLEILNYPKNPQKSHCCLGGLNGQMQQLYPTTPKIPKNLKNPKNTQKFKKNKF
jgi:hypothetical protein